MSMIDLFCIPYAGGSAHAIYGKWVEKLDPGIKLHPLELAGHGRRMGEPFHANVAEAVQDLLDKMRPSIVQRPYAVYGHSMGTSLAYELTVAVRASGLPQPAALFLSGRIPPHLKYNKEPMHKLSDAEFLEKIRKIGGTPAQFFESKDLLKLFLPILRHDYRMIEQYRLNGKPQPVDGDIVFFLSDEDQYVNLPEILEWEQYNKRSFEYHPFQGGHFFIHEAWDQICMLINRKLLGHGSAKDSRG
ncbi:thioesterase [Paenibacillus thiaminolyticus]|uniref:thioesterase II family protein n=1 Tax=Paenibacillus thiaminolyticus TaxID=49283 RepID=UPI001163FC52|nr:alpha/beta fold hydrolase [Paenibacillus thiaminolyticus]NGP59373.1 thioesterase [Paenibacillus thiaminolyticus]